ncbi:hypothetical protein JRO89_XS06G0268000 [Xanthoceras sorbifolium]|uniref:Uncharacterized protein n=1 Tax=Xanthoceras sorbifolium TaxID=99658 RepID=A0ABQ8I008_9ROSI|nr:hypothetical protein JRO89_XS06G0268000 [Xanthoceras sorbifolium]
MLSEDKRKSGGRGRAVEEQHWYSGATRRSAQGRQGFRGFKAVIEDVMELLAAFNIANYILQIASLDLQGLTKHMKVVAKVLDEFMEKIIDEHVQSNDDSRTKDFVDLMLSFMGSEDTDYSDKSRAYQSRNLGNKMDYNSQTENIMLEL